MITTETLLAAQRTGDYTVIHNAAQLNKIPNRIELVAEAANSLSNYRTRLRLMSLEKVTTDTIVNPRRLAQNLLRHLADLPSEIRHTKTNSTALAQTIFAPPSLALLADNLPVMAELTTNLMLSPFTHIPRWAAGIAAYPNILRVPHLFLDLKLGLTTNKQKTPTIKFTVECQPNPRRHILQLQLAILFPNISELYGWEIPLAEKLPQLLTWDLQQATCPLSDEDIFVISNWSTNTALRHWGVSWQRMIASTTQVAAKTQPQEIWTKRGSIHLHNLKIRLSPHILHVVKTESKSKDIYLVRCNDHFAIALSDNYPLPPGLTRLLKQYKIQHISLPCLLEPSLAQYLQQPITQTLPQLLTKYLLNTSDHANTSLVLEQLEEPLRKLTLDSIHSTVKSLEWQGIAHYQLQDPEDLQNTAQFIRRWMLPHGYEAQPITTTLML